MILTLTPNPALDVSGTVPQLVPNEKSYISHEMRFPGGNGINAARIAHRLGSEVLTTGFLGGTSGLELLELLKLEKIPNHFIDIQGKTRTNITISNELSHEQTRLSFPGPRINKKEMGALFQYMKSSQPSLIVIGGSLPMGISPAFIKMIIDDFNHKGVPTFVDTPGSILKQVLSTKPFFIKPNLTEFQEMTGKKLTKIYDVLTEARKLSSSIPLQCISSVEGGALLVAKDYAWFGKTHKIKVQSTVGAGDSMVGAMAHSFIKSNCLLNEKTSEKMLRWGLAAACATLSCKGLTMASSSSIKAFYPSIIIRKIG